MYCSEIIRLLYTIKVTKSSCKNVSINTFLQSLHHNTVNTLLFRINIKIVVKIFLLLFNYALSLDLRIFPSFSKLRRK